MARRPRYAFKAQAVRMVLEDGRKVCEVADQPVLSPDTLKNRLGAARAGKTEVCCQKQTPSSGKGDHTEMLKLRKECFLHR